MEMRNEVKEHYARVARAVSADKVGPSEAMIPEASSCSCSCEMAARELYPQDVADGLPIQALKASRGCGNPLGEIELKKGQTVLDLGSGGGIDCLIAATEVGKTGYVYGLDMTDEMLELANKNKQVAHIDNVEFIKGFIEDIPLPNDCVDVISSNCVINLSEDKARVLREAYRVLNTKGRFIVADIIALKAEFEDDAGLDAARIFGCRSGVISEKSYIGMMAAAGFKDITVRVYQRYSLKRVRSKAVDKGIADIFKRYSDEQLNDAFGAAFISGYKA